MEQLSRLFYYNYELMQRVILPACSQISGKPILQFTAIMDLSGVSMTDLMSKNVYNMVSVSSKMVQEYYPEIVHKSYIINTPMLFSGFFNLIKPLLGARTQAALSMPGGKFKKDLVDAIDPQFLPVEYGGVNPDNPGDSIDRGAYVKFIQKSLELKKWDLTLEDFAEKKPELAAQPEEPAKLPENESPEIKEAKEGQTTATTEAKQ